MKIFCTVLIAILVIHLQCRASCLVDSLKAPTTPPCHQHHSDESKNRCGGQVSTADAKLVPVAVVTPLVFTAIRIDESLLPRFELTPPASFSLSTPPLSLRI